MKTIEQAAIQSAGRAYCDKCEFFMNCTEQMIKICSHSHVRGFKKGYEYHRKTKTTNKKGTKI